MTARERLHRLIEELPDTHVDVAERAIESLRATADPHHWATDRAPWDVEGPDSDGEAQAVAEAREQFGRSEAVVLEDLEKEFGLR